MPKQSRPKVDAPHAADADFLDAIPVTPQDVEDEEIRQDLWTQSPFLHYLGITDLCQCSCGCDRRTTSAGSTVCSRCLSWECEVDA
jgi:hypothetical protein